MHKQRSQHVWLFVPFSFQILVRSNNLSDKIIVLSGKIEEISLPENVDVVISEPMGYMLFNERMLESYLHSKKWLKSNGECANTVAQWWIRKDNSFQRKETRWTLQTVALDSAGLCLVSPSPPPVGSKRMRVEFSPFIWMYWKHHCYCFILWFASELSYFST